MAMTENEAFGRLIHLKVMQRDPAMADALDVVIRKRSMESPYAHAADDMYDALEAAIALIEGWNAGATEADVKRVMGQINNAIRKASGEE